MPRSLGNLLALLLTLAAARADAATSFVAPLEGAQVIGLTLVEVRTDATAVDRVDFFVDGVLAGVAREAPYRIAHDFGTSLARRTVTAKVWTAGFTASETASMSTAAPTVNDTVDVHLVEVPVRAVSSRAIRPEDLRVRENGVDQKVRDVIRERPPAHFAFVIDRSLSMNEGKLEATLTAVGTQLQQLRADDTASLVFFDHHVAAPRAIRRGEDLVQYATTPSGGTSLRDAVASVSSRERTYAIVITDGGDRNSELSDEDALRKISGTKTTVYAIVLGRSHARFLDEAAKNTGGSVTSASASSVRGKLTELLADINSRYLVVYQSSGSGPGWRTVEVRAGRGGVRIDNAQKRYFAE
jgi:hypothetical protein